MNMPKQILHSADLDEIRAAMTGLSGANARAEAERLAVQRGCHWSRIYDLTKDLRPRRKARTDRGRRRVDLKEHAGMALATSQVVAHNLNPELALELARASGHETPISVGTFRRQLREGGMNRGQLRSTRVVHRRFEASKPGEIFQFDITGLKERWIDTKTRRLLHVPEAEDHRNHRKTNLRRQRVWAFVCVDDYSRFIYVRFIAAHKPNSTDVIQFELKCFRELGVPLAFYTDNDAIIVSQWNLRAASILDRALAEHGGFKLEQHQPGNPNATGKVERGHQVIEEFVKLLGCCPEPPKTIEALNLFAQRFCDRKNWTEHRATNMRPAIRFNSFIMKKRVPADAIFDAAFNAKDIEGVKVNSDVTISVEGIRWQLPRTAFVSFTLHGREKNVANPFLDLAARGQAIKRVVWTREADWFLAILHNDDEFELVKIEASADAAGEHKAVAESLAHQNKKHFQSVAVQVKQAAREAKKNGEQSPIVVPGVEKPFEIAAQSRPEMFPRREVTAELGDWAKGVIAPSTAGGRTLSVYAAAKEFVDEGLFEETAAGQVSQFDMGWLKSFFGDRVEVAESEIRAALESRGQLRSVEAKSA